MSQMTTMIETIKTTFKNKTFTSVDIAEYLNTKFNYNPETITSEVSRMYKNNKEWLTRKPFYINRPNGKMFTYVYCHRSKKKLLDKIKLEPAKAEGSRC